MMSTSDVQAGQAEHISAVTNPWARQPDDVTRALSVDPRVGLTEQQADRRQREFGPNRLGEAQTRSWWTILIAQFKSVIVALLAAAAIVSFVFGNYLEAIAIVAVIFVNAAIGFFTELRAVRSMEALRRLGQVKSKVRRDGQAVSIPAEHLVPGDIVLIEGGDIVSADLRLLEASKLQADESPLTGESVPVGKTVAVVEEGADIPGRKDMLFKGTTVTRGSGVGVVVATGEASEIGEISALVEQAPDEITPLEERLAVLGQKLVWVTLVIAAVTATAGILSGKAMLLMIETSIALAVAAIPEGLPIVATIALARGMWRMAQRNALINRLSAVETLGGTTVICTDKTGTLTENRMTVARYDLPDGPVEVRHSNDTDEPTFSRDGRRIDLGDSRPLRIALEVGALCNNAEFSADQDDENGIGDPLEIALLRAAALAGLDRRQLLEDQPERREEAFDPEVKMMATFHEAGNRLHLAVKGAADPILAASVRLLAQDGEQELTDQQRQHWLSRNRKLAQSGLRVLALATGRADSADANPYSDLTFVGLVGLVDPPRGGVREAIEQCHDAGIRVVMVTGDQPATATAVAREVGLITDGGEDNVLLGEDLGQEANYEKLEVASIFARVSPRQKLDLIAVYQDHGQVVAMTGDGVNDAPALKKADIGVAMGMRGTEVACEAADMILKDDAFSSIVAAVRQGRVIFRNIRQFVLFLMSCNLSEILVVGLASGLQMPLPILPLQILFLNMVTDVFPALALGLSKGDAEVMETRPRDPSEPVMTRRHWAAMAGYASLITASVLGGLLIALAVLGMDRRKAVTVSFMILAMSQLWHVFNMRAAGSGLLSNEITRNPWVWGALGLCVVLLLAALYVPGLSAVLQTASPGAAGWATILLMSIIPLLVGQIAKVLLAVRK